MQEMGRKIKRAKTNHCFPPKIRNKTRMIFSLLFNIILEILISENSTEVILYPLGKEKYNNSYNTFHRK